MWTILICIAVFFIFSLAFFIYCIKTAETYEPPQEHLKLVFEEESKTLFFNELSENYEAYDHGRLIKKSKDKFELLNLFFSEWHQ